MAPAAIFPIRSRIVRFAFKQFFERREIVDFQIRFLNEATEPSVQTSLIPSPLLPNPGMPLQFLLAPAPG